MTSLQELVVGQCWQAVKTSTTVNKYTIFHSTYNCRSGVVALAIMNDYKMEMLLNA